MAGTVVVVVGATGVGKSKLGVEMCEKFNGEVINADVVQVTVPTPTKASPNTIIWLREHPPVQMYSGLDVATNKVTLEEQRGIPHHLLGVLQPTIDTMDVNRFRNDVRPDAAAHHGVCVWCYDSIVRARARVCACV